MSDRTERFDSMGVDKANEECRPYSPDSAVMEQCPKCSMKVVIHCSECMIQISGCLCVEIDRFGELHARERMKQRGVWLPEWDNISPSDPRKLHG